MQEVSARAVRARAAAPPRGDRRSNYDVVQRHRQTTLGCASLTAVVFFIRVTAEQEHSGCGSGGAGAAVGDGAIESNCALHDGWRRALRGRRRARLRVWPCAGRWRATAGAHIVDVAELELARRELWFFFRGMLGSLRRAARPAATAASPDLEDAKPPPPRPRRRRLRAYLLAPAALATLAVIVGADSPTACVLLSFAALSPRAVAVAPAVRVPTLLLNALDDPFCVSQNVDDHRGLVLANPSLVLATTRRGGHLAFYEGLMAKPWAERVALEWLGAALEVVPGAASVPLS